MLNRRELATVLAALRYWQIDCTLMDADDLREQFGEAPELPLEGSAA